MPLDPETKEAMETWLKTEAGQAYELDRLESACYVVERELKRLRVWRVEIEYSEGCSVLGSKGSHRSVSLYRAIRGLQNKLAEDTTE